MRKLVLFFLFTFIFSPSFVDAAKHCDDEFEEIEEGSGRLQGAVTLLGKIARSRGIQAAAVFLMLVKLAVLLVDLLVKVLVML